VFRFLGVILAFFVSACLLAWLLVQPVGRAFDQHHKSLERASAAILDQNPELKNTILGHSAQQQRPGCPSSSARGVAVFMVTP